MPKSEKQMRNAMARLAAAGGFKLGERTKFADMFRAYSLLAPVWDRRPRSRSSPPPALHRITSRRRATTRWLRRNAVPTESVGR
jgi:hypothetical protein